MLEAALPLVSCATPWLHVPNMAGGWVMTELGRSSLGAPHEAGIMQLN